MRTPIDYMGTLNGKDLTIYEKTGDAMVDGIAYNGGGGYIATINTKECGMALVGSKAQDNAAHIVKCVNAHDRLTYLLQTILDVWDEHHIIGPTVYHDARAALAEVEG